MEIDQTREIEISERFGCCCDAYVRLPILNRPDGGAALEIRGGNFGHCLPAKLKTLGMALNFQYFSYQAVQLWQKSGEILRFYIQVSVAPVCPLHRGGEEKQLICQESTHLRVAWPWLPPNLA